LLIGEHIAEERSGAGLILSAIAHLGAPAIGSGASREIPGQRAIGKPIAVNRMTILAAADIKQASAPFPDGSSF
jgi:hypothetical protein